ncbi:hypothetical protein PsAD37_03632 [Pseudovibrio sp. Ad37]|nr:hypothetical protein PsAD37_03632 [Pseudovibrio sp. Ad37]
MQGGAIGSSQGATNFECLNNDVNELRCLDIIIADPRRPRICKSIDCNGLIKMGLENSH